MTKWERKDRVARGSKWEQIIKKVGARAPDLEDELREELSLLESATISTVHMMDGLARDARYHHWYRKCQEIHFEGIWGFSLLVADFGVKCQIEWTAINGDEHDIVADDFFDYMAGRLKDFLQQESSTARSGAAEIPEATVAKWAKEYFKPQQEGNA